MRTWLDLLLGFFILGIADKDAVDADAGAADADADADAGAADADAGADADADADLDLDAGDDADADDGGAAAAAEAAKALKAAEDKAAELQARLDAASRQAPGKTPDELTHEQEEARLRDPKTTELERWQINSNRTLRENKRASSMALFQAQDVADKTAFNQLAITKPEIHKRYAERVEKEIARMRASGQNAPREAVLRYLIGNDALEGKLSGKKGAATAAAAATVDRGRSPGARSDVKGNGRLTESQRREKRLDGVQI